MIGDLSRFLHAIRQNPDRALHVTSIILDLTFDDQEDSGVYELLFLTKNNANSDSGLDAVDSNATAAADPFERARDELRLATAPLEAADVIPYEWYIKTVAACLEACENLQAIFLPVDWVLDFPLAGFRQVKLVGVTLAGITSQAITVGDLGLDDFGGEGEEYMYVEVDEDVEDEDMEGEEEFV
ncbi:hypothetical protein K469DRAFT_688273 [Zopfia rhizophila CBS 207.26]|uniref:Uncharacterized protein n=1 Tax=Zopfia rhizophila CBS 207.26 TaxID=1314779 RepID=A0A6A6E5A5_9PEZI|nr:hypothetical protein K469DRAFT_688273 [Zopfia rhizophila CBS 207.26]